MLVLGIETSCDETAAAVVRSGRDILSSVIYSQISTHQKFGGVVPELASREHLLKIDYIVERAFEEARVRPEDINGIAVTAGPGLIGSLHVGVSYAAALAYGMKVPIVGVNHIEGHFYSALIENPLPKFPILALIVSGGHTHLYFSPEEGIYQLIARTRDDAAGEAYDKLAKMIGLGYPGGPIIEKLAQKGNPKAYKFTKAKITDGRPDFSFSGLKTAASRLIKSEQILPFEPFGNEQKQNGGSDADPSVGRNNQKIFDLAASFQYSVNLTLTRALAEQAIRLKPKTLVIAGGVACNSNLRELARAEAEKLNLPLYFPSRHLSTDNAAMIAAAGYHRLSKGQNDGLEITANPSLKLAPAAETKGKKLPYKV
ncbi:MAG TPA: tRNA (adenosine(37)-N6)-threonylcarbamoyltransferase complex transferase subunit TsaD [Pyrinomonadaceae bacterium]|nr:tRNA (adenosine(37)-N6)-threonylcarbamoyltransferase complex transferase subunit TsaD [Pyrinomonadaceae bacterium]